MKKIFLTITLLIFNLVSFAQMASVSGINQGLNLKPEDKINFYAIEDGTLKLLSSTCYGEGGSFGFMYNIKKEGFYAIGNDNIMAGQFPVYLKPGDAANVTINGLSMHFTGKNSAENIILGKWFTLSDTVRLKSIYFNKGMSTYKDFFPVFEKFLTTFDEFSKSVKTSNKIFNSEFVKWIAFDRDLIALNYIYTPRTIHPSADERPLFYKNLNSISARYPNDDIFNFMYGIRLLQMYTMFTQNSGGKNDQYSVIESLATDRQKGEMLMPIAERLKDYPLIMEFDAKYRKYFTTENLKNRLDSKIRSLFQKGGANTKAIDFTYPDVYGKNVSLSDFKGKVVLVDVWATWCSPCKAQIPFMQEMEKEFHGKDVVFISVSVDEEKDKSKWLDMIKEKEMGGVQLFASGWSKITKDYDIKAIPRFLLFDRNGNVYSTEAPRPSDPMLKDILNKLLVK